MAYLGRNPAIGTQKVLDSLESQFNGALTTFNLRYTSNVVYPTLSSSLIVSLGGVLQEPGTAYTVASDQIIFASAPGTGTDCWILLYSEFGAQAGATPSLIVANNATIGGELHGPANFVIDPAVIGNNTGTVEIKGNLTVQGTTTTINSTVVDLDTLSLGDNEKISLGAGGVGDNGGAVESDLEIYSDGTNAYFDSGFIASSASPNIYFRTSASTTLDTNALTILNSGNVGIGQSTPTKKLEVGGGAVSFSPDVAGKHTHEFTTNAANDARYFLRSNTTTKVDIQANGASYFNGGEVLIGTTIDANIKLDVEGSLRAKAAAYVAPTSGVGLELYYATGTLNDTPTAYISSYDRDASAYKKINYDASDHKFRISGTAKLRIDSAGSLITGSDGVSESIGGGPNAIQSNNGISVLRRTNDAFGPYINLAKSRNTTAGQSTIIQDNDIVGSIGFCGDDGVDLNSPLAYINGVVDGTPAANSIPGALSFRTVASSTVSTERLRIRSDGKIFVGGDGASATSGELWFNDTSAYSSIIKQISGSSALAFHTGQSQPERLCIDSAGHVTPGADDTQDLGSTSKRWRNIYTGDLQLSNEGSSNEVDGTWGNYTIQEGEEELFIINRRSGKKFKFVLEEVK